MSDPVSSLLTQAARRWPDRVAIIDHAETGRREHSFAELDLAARRAAAQLHAVGVGPSDRVALAAENGAGLAAAWFGIVYAGAAVIPVPVTSAAAEMAQRLAHARCRAAVFDRGREALALAAAAASGRSVALLSTDDLDGDAARGAPLPAGADAPAMILYTSGTTGQARAAVISHRALVRHTRAIAATALRFGAEDRILGVLPLTHSYGWRMVMLTALVSGCAVVLLPRFHAAGSVDVACAEDVTWIPGVPTMFAAWGALPSGAQPTRLRWCLSAGAPLPDEACRRAEARLGAEVRQGYGMTEATFCTINAPPDERVHGSVGLAAPNVEVRIVGEGDADLAAGATGEVLVRGDNLMSGYLDDPDATAQAMHGGWMHTGDLGRLDESGRLHVVDRLKDMIIRGGNNVYPAEVEAVLASHPSVQEVAVVGRPDPYYGEEVVAVIVSRAAHAAAEDLRAWAATRLGAVKVPREYAFVDALPLGPSRKVLKRTLRDWIADGTLATVRPTRE